MAAVDARQNRVPGLAVVQGDALKRDKKPVPRVASMTTAAVKARARRVVRLATDAKERRMCRGAGRLQPAAPLHTTFERGST